jgi:hypothetical protein
MAAVAAGGNNLLRRATFDNPRSAQDRRTVADPFN